MEISQPHPPTDRMPIVAAEHLFGPPAPKPIPLWALTCGILVLLLGANLLHAALQPAHPAPVETRALSPLNSTASRMQSPTPLAIRGREQFEAGDDGRSIIKCAASDRTTFSDSARCAGSATMDVLSRLPELGTVGLTDHQRQRSESANARIAAQAIATPAGPAANGGATARSPECAALERDIRSLDSASKVLLSPSQQDAIRATREKDRSRRFALGC